MAPCPDQRLFATATATAPMSGSAAIAQLRTTYRTALRENRRGLVAGAELGAGAVPIIGAAAGRNNGPRRPAQATDGTTAVSQPRYLLIH